MQEQSSAALIPHTMLNTGIHLTSIVHTSIMCKFSGLHMWLSAERTISVRGVYVFQDFAQEGANT